MSASTRFDLLADEIRRHRQHAEHAARILGGQGGDRRRGIAAERGDGLDVRLDAGAAAGIGAGDDEDPSLHSGRFLGSRGGRLAIALARIHDDRRSPASRRRPRP